MIYMQVYFHNNRGESKELQVENVIEGENGIYLYEETAPKDGNKVGYIPYGMLNYVGPSAE